MKKPVIVSVPHTGTRFLKSHFNADHVHTMYPWNELLERLEGYDHLIVPLRHPKEVWESWCRRDKFNNPHRIAIWYACWWNLHALSLVTDLDVICIDKKDDERIKDWKIVGHDPGYSKYARVDIALSTLWHLPIVAENYEVDPE